MSTGKIAEELATKCVESICEELEGRKGLGIRGDHGIRDDIYQEIVEAMKGRVHKAIHLKELLACAEALRELNGWCPAHKSEWMNPEAFEAFLEVKTRAKDALAALDKLNNK